MSFPLGSLTRALTAPTVQAEGLPGAPTAPSIHTFCHTWHTLGYNFYFTFLSPSQDSELLWVRDCLLFTISDTDSVTVRRKTVADLFQPVKARGLALSHPAHHRHGKGPKWEEDSCGFSSPPPPTATCTHPCACSRPTLVQAARSHRLLAW